MTIDVQLTWPGLAEALKTYECREFRLPLIGETYLSDVGNVTVASYSRDGDYGTDFRPILTPKWTYPSDKLPGSVCITLDRKGYVAWDRMPYSDRGEWRQASGIGMELLDHRCVLLGITLPPSTGDPSRDIWLNPAHPANQERSDD